jgi:hypothetical protein
MTSPPKRVAAQSSPASFLPSFVIPRRPNRKKKKTLFLRQHEHEIKDRKIRGAWYLGTKIQRGGKEVDKSKDFGAQDSATPEQERMLWLCEVLECGTARMLVCCSWEMGF